MKIFECLYSEISYCSPSPFHESYQKWINDVIAKTISTQVKIIFKEESFIINATNGTPLQLITTAQFIGYALGRQDSGY